nr:LOW QUALITY PROTEIN: BH3-interacting domain death agonist [Kogia breviceps]
MGHLLQDWSFSASVRGPADAPAHWEGVQALGQGGHPRPGCPARGHVPTGLSSQVSNGASPQDERTTSLLVFGFLQSYPHSRCHQELEVLGHELAVRVAHDDELQTDGNWCSHFRVEGAAETDSQTQEEVVRDIARQLAQVGDRMECSIRPGLVAGLAAQFRNTSLSEEERRRCLAVALEQLVQLCPADMDREKALLLLTMLVAKKVADHSPALLQDVFHTTVTFINQNLLAYVRDLVQNEMD